MTVLMKRDKATHYIGCVSMSTKYVSSLLVNTNRLILPVKSSGLWVMSPLLWQQIGWCLIASLRTSYLYRKINATPLRAGELLQAPTAHRASYINTRTTADLTPWSICAGQRVNSRPFPVWPHQFPAASGSLPLVRGAIWLDASVTSFRLVE